MLQTSGTTAAEIAATTAAVKQCCHRTPSHSAQCLLFENCAEAEGRPTLTAAPARPLQAKLPAAVWFQSAAQQITFCADGLGQDEGRRVHLS